MTDLVWLMDEIVLSNHEEPLSEHSGLAGIRDLIAVQSALVRPRDLANYEDSNDVAQLAAAYTFGIAKNHGFAGGNQRTALVVADLFLMLNGYELTSSASENVLTILGVVDGSISEDELAAWVRSNIQSFEDKLP